MEKGRAFIEKGKAPCNNNKSFVFLSVFEVFY